MKRDERERRVESNPLDVIRVETAISRFPIHHLARRGAVPIEVRETDTEGELTLHWEVGHHSKYGAPGPLAYRLDTLIVNRRIEKVARPVPSLIRLGSLSDLCRELDLADSGKNRSDIRRALYQNAFAGITAKIRYKARDGSERRIEIGSSRYAVVMTGETLPDSRRADAVYIIPHDFFRNILDTAQTRPLDYDYLRGLPPAAQRLYELLSYPMFGALKQGRSEARMRYSDFCTYAPQTRYTTLWEVRRQMENLHTPHRKAGYVIGVEYQATTDRDGQPDWTMIYTPGPKAKAEFKAFTTGKSGPVVPQAELPLAEAEIETTPEPTGLEHELVIRGVTRRVAVELVRDFAEERIRSQIERVDWLRAKRPKQVKDVGAYLADAIRKDYAAPAGFESAAQRAEREAIERAQDEQARQAKVRARGDRDRVKAFWEGLSPEARAKLEAEALAQADPEVRASCASGPLPVRRMTLAAVREAYIRNLLSLPPTS